MTMNNFYFVGIAFMNITLGVPWFTEIINDLKAIRELPSGLFLENKWSLCS